MSTKSIARIVIATLVIGGLFGLIAATLFVPIVATEIQIVDMLVGAMVAAFAVVVGYFFRGGK